MLTLPVYPIQAQYFKMKHKISIITGNKKKLEEFQHILGDEFELIDQNIDLPEMQGEPEKIAKEKSILAYKKLGKACVTEDTSLCFNAYKGLPGPYIKWFLESMKVEGLAKMVEPFQDKTGYGMCIVAYMSPELTEPKLFIGKTAGTIVAPRGSNEFGWDSVFQPEGYNLTYGEMPKKTKNQISSRFEACQKMIEYFKAGSPVESKKLSSPTKE